MNPEEELFDKYQHLAQITLHKTIPEPFKFAQSRKLEYDDLLQFCLIGLWKGCKSFKNDNKWSVKAYLIRNIKWNLHRSLRIENSKFQFYKSKTNDDNNMVTLMSMNAKINNDIDTELTFEEITSVDNIFNFESDNPETKVLLSIGEKDILKMLKPKDFEMLKLRMEGLTMQEIGDKYGLTRQGVSIRFVKLQERLNRKLGVV